MKESLVLDVADLCVSYAQSARLPWKRPITVPVVSEVSFAIRPNEIMGLVGESGSGKTTLSRALLRLLPATSGSVRFQGIDLLALPAAKLRQVRARMQVIFQDPYTSLNPRMTAADNIAEGIRLQHTCDRREIPSRVAAVLAQVGLPLDAGSRYPHEFSGGQRQRIGIARALVVEPTFLIADEPVSALDMSIQAQILNLLMEQQERRNLSMLFIGHDLSVIRHICDRVIVMYLGRIVEAGPAATLFRHPAHPYTQALVDAAPVSHPAMRRPKPLSVLEPVDRPLKSQGCPFSPRCVHRIQECDDTPPLLRRVGRDHDVACIRSEVAR
ncbi:ATP-binding cassette domain-containing protein [Lichenicola cladoniae]|uniref:ATP-binding cassette domain-containing protein n=1 Tax=Lichenicola cladoniae TaxID=1484109 RepID=A0A6M8HLP7_9PROT|nr:oligopeptide/dipeptide ABC transporter ATP-binding protein [Lichenicola cladoniae]NPD68949.1 ATP-binding cassette domain-containing protein [Acetobacteraceae bacterium]QKE89293.1 ATP-binding cassette domain-containing protein [Lichenicola cladoniae]